MVTTYTIVSGRMVSVDNIMATWLINEMKQRNWSMRELARRAGLSHVAISNVINGERRPGIEFCKGVADAFNVAPETVMRKAGILGPEPPQTASLIEANRLFAQLTDEERRMKIVEMRALIERRRSAELATDTA